MATILQTKTAGPSALFQTDGIEAITLDSAATVGSRLVLWIQHGDRTLDVSTVTDNRSGGSHTYTEAFDATDNTVTFSRHHWWSTVVTAACTVITVTLAGGDPNPAAIVVWELSDPDTGTATNGTSSLATADTASYDSGSIATTQALVTFLGGCTGGATTMDVDADFTATWEAVGYAAGSRIVTATETTSMTTAGEFGDGFASLVAWRNVSGGGGGPTTAGIRIAPAGFA